MTALLARVKVGDAIGTTQKTIYQRALVERQFSADSIHNDAYTKTKGYPGALVSAYVLAGYMSELLVRFFGPSWFTTGRVSLSFIGKGTQLGDRVTCGGKVAAVAPGPDGMRVTLDLWIEKEDGTRPVLGTASAVLPDGAG